MNKQEQRNSLNAVFLYELSRIEQLPIDIAVKVASELTVAIQTLRISKEYADLAFHQNQATHYAILKRDMLGKLSSQENQVRFASASIMHCIYKAFEFDGLQNEFIALTLNWVQISVAKVQS